jgi:hypothetical protein
MYCPVSVPAALCIGNHALPPFLEPPDERLSGNHDPSIQTQKAVATPAPPPLLRFVTVAIGNALLDLRCCRRQSLGQ